ncbi:hypothetical protein [Streptomyces sp. WAC 01325]|uniref:hypothetical protein n=1 Tax=Streptomyces sp. WAC 01325 TaxID=2203202 RepID=UPI00163D3C89|nr:hypothetical protein [Streptomyces sp. WAC 01325]
MSQVTLANGAIFSFTRARRSPLGVVADELARAEIVDQTVDSGTTSCFLAFSSAQDDL